MNISNVFYSSTLITSLSTISGATSLTGKILMSRATMVLGCAMESEYHKLYMYWWLNRLYSIRPI